jgi:formamidopyrimidine-DNA glycosylase
MPELPEVEVVRRGLQEWVAGRTVDAVEVRHPRAVRRHEPGATDFARRVAGRRVRCVSRRGKYLWLPLADDAEAIVGHLGMSGQLLLLPADQPDGPHLRVRVTFADGGRELRFVDQRTFGGLALAPLVPDEGAGHLPEPVRHIARDPLDPLFEDEEFVARVRARESEVKRILLDQTVASADESLWRVRLHGGRPGRSLSRPQVRALLSAVRDVMDEALEQGGTSFDALYVNVNGESGYFDRSLQAYGREGEPCDRCGTPIRRIAFMNRSSYFCPRCQRGARGQASVRR